MVRIRRCSSPLSPTALRTALMRLVSVESETMRPCQTAIDQIILADDAFAVLHQIDQQVEYLRADRNGFRPAREFATIDVECAVSK